MARARQVQVPLGPTQPPFPGGWVLAVLDAVRTFSPDLAVRHNLPKVARTANRLRNGEPVYQSTHDVWEAAVTAIMQELFPRVSAINGFAQNYVNEYFRLWFVSAKAAPFWVKAVGLEPAKAAVLARALVRDLMLRLCYLESCEYRLASEASVAFLEHQLPEAMYRSIIEGRKKAIEGNDDDLAAMLKVSGKSVQRWKSGAAAPSWANLCTLAPDGDVRTLGGVGFMDCLLRRLGLREEPLAGELLPIAGILLREHPTALEVFRGRVPISKPDEPPAFKECGFEEYARYGELLLTHPGFNTVWAAMPDALWRAHVYALCVAQPFELARAYLQFGEANSDRHLIEFLRESEKESPHAWQANLNRVGAVVPFRN